MPITITSAHLRYPGVVRFATPGWNYADVTFDVPPAMGGASYAGGTLSFENMKMVVPAATHFTGTHYYMVPFGAWHVEAQPDFVLDTASGFSLPFEFAWDNTSGTRRPLVGDVMIGPAGITIPVPGAYFGNYNADVAAYNPSEAYYPNGTIPARMGDPGLLDCANSLGNGLGTNTHDPFGVVTYADGQQYLYHTYPQQLPIKQSLSANKGGRLTFRLAAFVDKSGATLDLLDIRFRWSVITPFDNSVPGGGTLSPPGTELNPLTGSSAFIGVALLSGQPDPTRIIPVSGAGGGGASQSADIHEGLHSVSLAWIDSGGALRQAANPTPDDSAGWQSPIVLETSGAAHIGQVLLPNHRTVLAYDAASAPKAQSSDKLGFGAAGDWSVLPSISLLTGWVSGGRAQGQSFVFALQTGVVSFLQSQEDTGSRWSAVTAVAADAGGAGGAFLQDGYGCLYSRLSDGHILWLATDNPADWSGAAVDTGLTGQVASLCRLQNGILVGLSWDATSQKCRALRSYDRGATWEIDSADIAAIPALASGPCLVSGQGKAYACWQVGNVAASVLSVDGGKTWS